VQRSSSETAPLSSDDPPIFSAQYYAFPRTGWITGGLAALNLVAAVKFAIEGEWAIALYPLLGALAFTAWPVLALALRGTLEVTASSIRGRRRIGSFEIPRSSVVQIQRYGRRKRDDVGVELLLHDGSRRAIPRIRPDAAIQTLLGMGR
jgi:hypothetical protein